MVIIIIVIIITVTKTKKEKNFSFLFVWDFFHKYQGVKSIICCKPWQFKERQGKRGNYLYFFLPILPVQLLLFHENFPIKYNKGGKSGFYLLLIHWYSTEEVL